MIWREDLRDALLYVFGPANVSAVRAVCATGDISIANIDRVARPLGANRSAVAAYFGWLHTANDPRLRVHMWTPGPIAGVLDYGDVPLWAGWALCRLLTVPGLGWPRECARRLLLENDLPEFRQWHLDALRGWEPGQPAAQH